MPVPKAQPKRLSHTQLLAFALLDIIEALQDEAGTYAGLRDEWRSILKSIGRQQTIRLADPEGDEDDGS